MATGDRDALQLVSDQTYVELVTTRMGQTTTQEMDPAAFREKYGFAPAQMVDLKALMGDASDNVPGVPGVGKRPPLALLRDNGTLAGGLRPPGPGDPGDPAGDEEAAGGRAGERLPLLRSVHHPAGRPPGLHPGGDAAETGQHRPAAGAVPEAGLQKLIAQMGLEAQGASPSNLPLPHPPKRWCG